MKKNKLNFIMTMISLIYNAVLLVGVAVILQNILDVATSKDISNIKGTIIMSCIYIILLSIGWLVERHFRNRFIERAMCQYKESVFSGILKKSIFTFSKESTGRYISALTNDINSIEGNLLQANFTILLNCAFFVIALGIMFWYHVWLTISAVGFTAFSFLVSVTLGGKLASEEKKVSERNESFVGLIKDYLSGFSVIKSFKAEREIQELFEKNNAVLEHTKCHRRKTESLIGLVGNCSGFLVQGSVMILGAYFVIKGQITAGVLVAFVQLMNYIIQPVQSIPSLLANRKAAMALVYKMDEALSNIGEEMGTLQLKGSIGQIALTNASFSYNEAEHVLENISLTFEEGKCYAIVGSSGSGKSTLLNLLMGSFKNYTGNVTYQGKELRDLSVDSLYDNISVIWQNVYVFDDNIANNITMFQNSNSEHVKNVAEQAGLLTLLEEKGYNYKCGENGNELSGGEKQRIAIARSLLRDTQILLVDEATSALDTTTSAVVENTILELKETTRIVVTHKLDARILKKYDGIVVLQKGKLIGFDSFETLMDKCEYFKTLMGTT
ncbi:ABC transporter ATP-binding protein [Anaerosporobacter sp.]|uniref:ABC transporter ATP-binding protein n=1 Tax=Anaerosporobacter sp. TaxID=1872529 RepID=UPI00286FA773|nr:ABC transporter ATP-binding protein [Anaerosporobacter sp.]